MYSALHAAGHGREGVQREGEGGVLAHRRDKRRAGKFRTYVQSDDRGAPGRRKKQGPKQKNNPPRREEEWSASSETAACPSHIAVRAQRTSERAHVLYVQHSRSMHRRACVGRSVAPACRVLRKSPVTLVVPACLRATKQERNQRAGNKRAHRSE